MKKTYAIEVDCANCANKMEAAVRKVPGIVSATVSFMTQRLTAEFTEGADVKAVMQEVLRVCRRVEPDCEIEF